MRAVLTMSEVNEHKLNTVKHLCSVFDAVVVLLDEKFAAVNALHGNWNAFTHPHLVTTAMSYETSRVRYGRKIDVFNGRWSNNPAKIAAIENAARHDGHTWVFEDDVMCKDWLKFTSAYHDTDADLLATVAPSDDYPWFCNGWLVGNRCHLAPGVAALYAFRISRAAASAVVESVRHSLHLSHHELFVPWSVADARLTQRPLKSEHSATMRHNHSQRGNVGISFSDYEQREGLIFHPVKTPVGRTLSRVAKQR